MLKPFQMEKKASNFYRKQSFEMYNYGPFSKDLLCHIVKMVNRDVALKLLKRVFPTLFALFCKNPLTKVLTYKSGARC